MLVGERELGDRALHDLADVALARALDARVGDVHARDGSEPSEVDHVAAAAAAGIEDLRIVRQIERAHQLIEDPPPSPVPPVPVLQLVRLLLEKTVHHETPRPSLTPPRRKRCGR